MAQKISKNFHWKENFVKNIFVKTNYMEGPSYWFVYWMCHRLNSVLQFQMTKKDTRKNQFRLSPTPYIVAGEEIILFLFFQVVIIMNMNYDMIGFCLKIIFFKIIRLVMTMGSCKTCDHKSRQKYHACENKKLNILNVNV